MREKILHKIRTGLGRSEGEAPPQAPAVRLRIPSVGLDARVASLTTRIEALAGSVVACDDARSWIERRLNGCEAVASNSVVLAAAGITRVQGVHSGITDREQLRTLCATLPFGITSADYALADTGTLVMLASPEEARLVSLLPPHHIAVVPRTRILTGLDELFTLLPDPAARTSSMVMITGPSRTADIEQILVRGVHGPGELTVLLVD